MMNIRRSIIPIEIPGSRVRVAFGNGCIRHVGPIARAEGATRAIVITDRGIVLAGHVGRAMESLMAAGVQVAVFESVRENPTTEDVDAAVAAAREHRADFIIGLGGGSSMDTAKGANFILTNGGRMQDYWGVGKATRDMLPMIAIPTTAGTGSEAQSFALITDPQTHQKMACGDVKAACRVAMLDPELTATQPQHVAAATGIDAIAHAVETSASTRRNDVSRAFSRDAFRLLRGAYVESLRNPGNGDAREAMLLGAHLAGAAIENSMLGAAHACANPLTAFHDITHGVAVGLMLPHVIRFNAEGGCNPYGDISEDAGALADEIERMLEAAELPRTLADAAVPVSTLERMAAMAAKQWTATFNPRAVGVAQMREIYERARR